MCASDFNLIRGYLENTSNEHKKLVSANGLGGYDVGMIPKSSVAAINAQKQH